MDHSADLSTPAAFGLLVFIGLLLIALLVGLAAIVEWALRAVF